MIDKIYKLLIYILMIITFLPFTMQPEENNDFIKLSKQYKWLDKNIYNIIIDNSTKYNVNKKLICAIIQRESNGKNIRSKKNRNGSRDYGLMQINEIHSKKNIKALYNYKTNIKIGTWYLSLCLRKSKGNIKKACMYYNGGLNCNVFKYKANKMRYKNYICSIYKSYIGYN